MTLKQRLQSLLRMDVELVLTENRSTMLSLLEKRGGCVRLSVHKMFLEAPDAVISALAHYVRGTRAGRGARNQVLRSYIQTHLSHHDYTHLVDPQKFVQKGKIYHLQPFYDRLNERYFEGKLSLSLTWFGSSRRVKRSHIVFGQYLAGLRVIKIHRILDDAFFPEYFVEFVLYHEMLHSVVPNFQDARGRMCFHGKDFKERERAFEHYYKAIEWEKNNKKHLFVKEV
jgi:hypothetical protein